ncbi:hypothetical protein [Dubosiella newyorkensis]|uniref:hypothetical protein n=1 Tax=Dubosiella newyorkensis TaxID=1862672 RepID=UPI00272DD195|nr:hypothetical protein [Dubosiella newyorkensis]
MGKIKDALKRGEMVDQSALIWELENEKEEERKDQIVSLLEDIRQLLKELVQNDEKIKKAIKPNELLDRAEKKAGLPHSSESSRYHIGPRITIKKSS